MTTRRFLFIFASFPFLFFIAMTACRAAGEKQPATPKAVLVFSKTSWYRHEAIPAVNDYLVKLGTANGFTVDVTEDAAAFTPENLARYRVVVFNSTTDIGKSLEEPQKAAFIAWFRKGGGYVGLHAAAVHHNTWDWYTQLYGTNFNSDTDRHRARLDIEKPNPPATRGFGKEIWIEEEWFHFEKSVRGVEGVTVLLNLDESTFDTTPKVYFRDKGGKAMGGKDHPVAWTRKFEGGRLFYTNLGHDTRSLETDFGRAHVLAGLRWAAGE